MFQLKNTLCYTTYLDKSAFCNSMYLGSFNVNSYTNQIHHNFSSDIQFKSLLNTFFSIKHCNHFCIFVIISIKIPKMGCLNFDILLNCLALKQYKQIINVPFFTLPPTVVVIFLYIISDASWLFSFADHLFVYLLAMVT